MLPKMQKILIITTILVSAGFLMFKSEQLWAAPVSIENIMKETHYDFAGENVCGGNKGDFNDDGLMNNQDILDGISLLQREAQPNCLLRFDYNHSGTFDANDIYDLLQIISISLSSAL